MKILITGGSGFIGTSLIKKLSDHKVIIFSKNDSDFSKHKNITLEFGNIESDDIVDIIDKHKPQLVIHLAALSGLTKCEKNPLDAFHVNVFGTFNVVNSCLKTNSKLIFVSSREVYGNTLNVESKEDDPLLPTNVYGITKMLGESLVTNAGKNDNLDYVILRLTNVYGPGGNGKGPNKIIKNAVEEKKIEIYGGEQIMNFTYIDDVAELIYFLIDKNHLSQEIFNIGSKDNLSINEFSKLIEESLDFDIVVEHMPKQKIENSVFRPNLTKLENMLHFTMNTEIHEGIKKTIDWYSK